MIHQNIRFDKCTKFFNSIHIEGFIFDSEDYLESIQINDERVLSSIVLEHLECPTYNLFSCQLFLCENNFFDDITIEFLFKQTKISTTLGAIQKEILHYREKSYTIHRTKNKYLNDPNYKKVLDIGGRARSGVLRAETFRDKYNKDVDVLDIIEEEGVDFVGDCHEMSTFLPNNHYDLVISIAVFEHLIMPWKVALEMNKVMRTGAVGFIVTHQTIGMHDIPWDFFRFSDTAWNGIFNKHTGFEILGTEMTDLQYILPFCYEEELKFAEKSAGYRTSIVIVKKISDTKEQWTPKTHEVISNLYPSNE